MADQNNAQNRSQNGGQNGGQSHGASNQERMEIAIIGTGIIGCILSLGLLSHFSVTIYEQAQSHREIGAGIAFTANARQCMARIDSRLPDCVAAVATINGDPACPNDSMQFVDGFTHRPDDDVGDDLHGRRVFTLSAGPRGFQGCHRAQFLEEVMRLIPPGVVRFSKRLVSLSEQDGRIKLDFADESVEYADAVIGCDGIKSRVRQLLHPHAHPQYTHKIAYRGLIPMEDAISTLGLDRARTQCMYGGPGAHLLHFPVAQQRLMNVVAFAGDANDWPKDLPMAQPATRDEAARVFENWGPTVRAVIRLLPDEMDKWAVFDSLDSPPASYAAGCVAIAGDAAHASSPHHGAGAGIGIEDALALSTVLGWVSEVRTWERKRALQAAFQAYSTVRRERAMWLVRSSREVCDIYEWNHPDYGSDMERSHEDVRARSHRIWYFDIDGMLRDLRDEYRRLIEADVSLA
ncbi:hypothetical protein EYZ11_000408 [Aspergillus tanneri]|uniref:FAD-binding domain-containing protein n=1 Tax=Aspergillus tanneri TaxID=1220188 RepID=A0A4S3JX49_9EURO|nr:uncharacterized protein ATNIH1004_006820 [Aspergillus tanneri]KAA8645401.1 hypothetical protein ATNIH1004_006820 [Aspergillus tanneri]THD00083.1 hypothetical protein EYZ11_000408 [Aspergillus tanneri]